MASKNNDVTADDPLFILVRILKPMSSEERQKLVRSAMTYVGEEWGGHAGGGSSDRGGSKDQGKGFSADKSTDSDDEHRAISLKGQKWMKQSDVTGEALDNIYNFTSDSVDLLVMPGKSKKEMTINTYVLFGLTQYLKTGAVAFSDSGARKMCVDVGCFDGTNHAAYIKDRGNLFSGDKDAGWTLSTAGLAKAAALIKQYQSSA